MESLLVSLTQFQAHPGEQSCRRGAFQRRLREGWPDPLGSMRLRFPRIPSDAGAAPSPATVSAGTSLAETVNVTDVSPSIFVATKVDFSLIQPSNPVAVGDPIILWTTGLGEATPPVEAGRLAPPAPPISVPNATPTATMDGISATVLATALSPGFAGLEQVAVAVPSGVGSGPAAVEITVSGRTANVIQIHVA